ncbi:TatD family hydrolase [Candidatus Micrarchaeota archaeon]|nr:TatD family hydrolase [Candidatus Micrarchaeota archaeon]
MRSIDSHCHLNSFPESDLASVIEEAKAFGLRAIVSSGFDFESSVRNVEIARANEGFVFPVAGFAPQRAQEFGDVDVKAFEELLELSSVVAVGEIGLDFKWGDSEEKRKRQEKAFRLFLSFARENNLPVVVHSRSAEARVLEVLRVERVERVLMHCFSGGKEEARACVDRNYFISVPPVESGSRSRMLKTVPLEFLLVESDAPFIGGKPIDIIKSAELIARALSAGVGEVEKAALANAKCFFGLKP